MSAAASVITQWEEWLERVTDRLMQLDERIGAGVLADDESPRLDLAAAFVCRKAVARRLDDLRADPASAPSASAAALYDDHGELVAADLASAAALLTAVVDRVEAAVTAADESQRSLATDRASIRADLDAAERLAADLGHHVQRTAALRDRFESAVSDPAALRGLVPEAASLRTDLERLAVVRTESFAAWGRLEGRLAGLRERERSVRALVERCREKVRPLPVLATPSVDALGAVRDVADLEAMPWPAARAAMEPYLLRVDRIESAFGELERRFGAVLARRDELRGLLHAFRDKAAGSGLGEDASLEPLLRAAEQELWTAPCDVDAAGGLVEQYTAAVNRAIAARGPR